MKVDNRLNTAKLKIIYMIMLGMIFSFSAYYYFENEFNLFFRLLPVLSGITAVVYLFFLLRKSDYFFLEYLGNKVTVRYYTAHPFLRKYRAFEIQKSLFYDYKIKKKLFGFLQAVEFTVKTPKGEFKYPPLSISLLNAEQKRELIRILDELKEN